ncbi:MAG: aminotransferase class I/II-fold pyridoxal phosphate-dependent enzyme [Acidobacteria bacterium]|nr:aminotransferase class I/II-fold pyridoxal phosphate-dependent enzyme [Acidobacteriota bacterium]
MTDAAIERPWVPSDIQEFHDRHARAYRHFDAAGFRSEVDRLVAAHERFMDRDCICLYAGTNIVSPRVARLQASTVGSRPSLGYPGDKYETGMRHAEQLEVLAVEILRRIFRCQYVEYRVGSGSLANLYAYMACTRPGDRIMALPDTAAGHVTHHEAGAAGLYGLEVHDVPWDAAAMTVDLPALEQDVRRLQPRLIIVGASLALFPYPVREVRRIADSVGAFVMFDAAHLSGLIAGGEFQQPLAEGAHLMTCSTYKSFGGPAGGLVLTDSAALAERLDRIAYPGLTANFDLGRTAALVAAAADVLEYGRAYAGTCIANAQMLARHLAAEGCPVVARTGGGFTMSHHVAIRADRYGGGTRAARRLEEANILAGGIGLPGPPVAADYNGLRLGTQEITRWGMLPDDMAQIARLLCRVLVDHEGTEQVRRDVLSFRERFQQLHFVRGEV